MRRHDLTNKKTKTMTMKKTNTFRRHPFLSINFLSDAKRSKQEISTSLNPDTKCSSSLKNCVQESQNWPQRNFLDENRQARLESASPLPSWGYLCCYGPPPLNVHGNDLKISMCVFSKKKIFIFPQSKFAERKRKRAPWWEVLSQLFLQIASPKFLNKKRTNIKLSGIWAKCAVFWQFGAKDRQ